MILLIDTSRPTCHLSLIENSRRIDDQWEVGRELAHGLLDRIKQNLDKLGSSWNDIDGIGVFEGPGSFTGLRIGITVVNTLADANKIPIVGARGENWQNDAIEKLKDGKDEKIVLPFYNQDANITTPKK